MKKVNTRAVCAVVTAAFGYAALKLPGLDPANYWLQLSGTISGSLAAGAAALLAFYDNLFPRPSSTGS